MSKQVLTGDLAERSGIGNYKGVMLCNRPGEAQPKANRDGPDPFVSRVTVHENIGLNPTAWLPPHQSRKNRKQLAVLSKHKEYLRTLQNQRETTLVETMKLKEAKEQQKRYFADKLAKKRAKFRGVTSVSPTSQSPKRTVIEDEEEAPKTEAKPVKLTEKNLKELEHRDKKSRASSRQKPKWALSQKEHEEKEDQDIEDLLGFVRDLDYDKYIEDLEVRQALAIVKERVDEIRQDNEWKRKIVEMYNQEDRPKSAARTDAGQSDAGRSEAKSNAGKSDASIKSFTSKARSQIEDEQRERESKSGGAWDRTVRSTQTRSDKVSVTAEERVAKLVADQVLQAQPVRPKAGFQGRSFKPIHQKIARARGDEAAECFPRASSLNHPGERKEGCRGRRQQPTVPAQEPCSLGKMSFRPIKFSETYVGAAIKK